MDFSWSNILGWCWKHNLGWVAGAILFLFLTFTQALPADWRFQTVKEGQDMNGELKKQITAMKDQQDRNGEKINAILEVSLQTRLDDMRKERAKLEEEDKPVPDYLRQSIIETQRRLNEVRQ